MDLDIDPSVIEDLFTDERSATHNIYNIAGMDGFDLL